MHSLTLADHYNVDCNVQQDSFVYILYSKFHASTSKHQKRRNYAWNHQKIKNLNYLKIHIKQASKMYQMHIGTLSIERNPFSAQNQTLKILQSIYFAYEVGIISSYSNRISHIGTC